MCVAQGAGLFKLGNLAEHFGVLAAGDSLHDAEADARVLGRLLRAIGVADDEVVASAKPLTSFRAYREAAGADSSHKVSVGWLIAASLQRCRGRGRAATVPHSAPRPCLSPRPSPPCSPSY